MAYTTIDDPSAYFQTETYTGDGGGTRAVTFSGNSNLQPDWVWIKNRGTTNEHLIFDSVRGVQVALNSNDKTTDDSISNSLTAFNSDGFTVAANTSCNANNNTYVSWNWKETADAGFDIVSYTGNDTARTISHSLSAVPKMMIVKCRNVAKEWTVYHASLGNGKFMELDQTTGVQTATNRWNDTSPTSSVFTVGVDSSVNASNQTYIAYLFAEKQGYSKFGSYVANGNANGPFIYLGFKPAFILLANSQNNGENWLIQDNKRSNTAGTNPNAYFSYVNLNNAETQGSTHHIDMLSNGFKIKTANGSWNDNGEVYIFMAFAENPLVTSKGTPTTAR
jgi:hypothetical protein